MSLIDALKRVAEEYRKAQTEPFIDHPLANFVRNDLPEQARLLLGDRSENYIIKASVGQSQWTESPWLAIFDPLVTDSAQRGYYPVFLFSEEFDRVSLVLGQGTYSVRKEFGRRGPGILDLRARLLRERVPERRPRFVDGPFPIKSSNHAGGEWSTASAWGRTYVVAQMPSEVELRHDLTEMLRTYHLATSRGGVSLSEYDAPGYSDAEERGDLAPEEEGHKRERLHLRIETQRSRRLADKAKRFHGKRCKACDFEFETKYGALGSDYVEAHHVTPLSKLALDGPISVDPKRDFTVLCANCHRMIHKAGCPTLEEFRAMLF